MFLNILRRQPCKSVQYFLSYSGFKSHPSFSITLYVVLVQFKDSMGMSLEYMRVIYQIQHWCTSLRTGTVEDTHYKGETYNFKLYVWS